MNRPGLDDAAVIEASRAPSTAAKRPAYLGMTTWGEQGQLGGDALVQTAVVDRAGELP